MTTPPPPKHTQSQLKLCPLPQRSQRAILWTTPGAVWNTTLLFDYIHGISKVSLALPPTLVEGWLANNGSANFGLLMR